MKPFRLLATVSTVVFALVLILYNPGVGWATIPAQRDLHSATLVWSEQELHAIEEGQQRRTYIFSGLSPVPFNYMSLSWILDSGKQDQYDYSLTYESTDQDQYRNEFNVDGKEYPLVLGLQGAYCPPFYLVQSALQNSFQITLNLPTTVKLREVKLMLADHTSTLGTHSQSGLSSGTTRPPIISRSEWWGNLPQAQLTSPNWTPVYTPTTHMVLHHTDPAHNNYSNRAEAEAWVRSIWNWHAQTQGWGDIGYHFIVDKFGNIYHGRYNPQLDSSPLSDPVGGHTYDYNNNTVGIAMLGDFSSMLPSSAALTALEHLLAWRMGQKTLDPLGYATLRDKPSLDRITGHRLIVGTGVTQCPGTSLVQHLPTIRNNVSRRMRQVSSPNGGEVWPVGTSQTIMWDFKAVSGDVRVDLSLNGGSSWMTIISSTPNTGTAQWQVANAQTTQARIRVVSINNPTILDESDSNFVIAGLNIVSPLGGESWRNTTYQSIMWQSVGVVGNVRIDLSIDGGATWSVIIVSTPNDGTESWYVSATPTSNARIRITSITDPRIWAISPGSFTILPAEQTK